MLVLSRKPGESIRIGDAVVHVLQNTRGRVRLGIEADRSIEILRTEIAEDRRECRDCSVPT